MKKFGFSTVIASGLVAGVLGFAAPAQAGTDHQSWINQINPGVSVPQVDTAVQHSR